MLKKLLKLHMFLVSRYSARIKNEAKETSPQSCMSTTYEVRSYFTSNGIITLKSSKMPQIKHTLHLGHPAMQSVARDWDVSDLGMPFEETVVLTNSIGIKKPSPTKLRHTMS